MAAYRNRLAAYDDRSACGCEVQRALRVCLPVRMHGIPAISRDLPAVGRRCKQSTCSEGLASGQESNPVDIPTEVEGRYVPFICHVIGFPLKNTRTGFTSTQVAYGILHVESSVTWSSCMNFSMKATIRAFVVPSHRLSCPSGLWLHVLKELERRGKRRHEAGVFLLGWSAMGGEKCTTWFFTTTWDTRAYDSGVCILDGTAFAKLWALCRSRALTVVADVHTHGGRAFQSEADRTNPMVARPGHIAMIIPYFAIPAGRATSNERFRIPRPAYLD